MATLIITNDTQLRKYLPNAFATVTGESSFYDKVLPWLEATEQWLLKHFIGSDFQSTLLALGADVPLRKAAALVVAHETMRNAVPSLDLVLTPNGFGIVSNANVAPASRERVDRLVASLEASRDDAIEQLLALLFQTEGWFNSPVRKWFTTTLFPNIDLADLCGFTAHRWNKYLELRSQAIALEHDIAVEFVSPELLDALHDEVLAPTTELSQESTRRSHVIVLLRSVVVAALKGGKLNKAMLRDVVDFMRKHEDDFAEFKNSRTFKLFEPPIFENKKKAHGYFF